MGQERIRLPVSPCALIKVIARVLIDELWRSEFYHSLGISPTSLWSSLGCMFDSECPIVRSVRSEYKGPSKGSPVSVFGRTRLFPCCEVARQYVSLLTWLKYRRLWRKSTLYRHPNFKYTLCLYIDRTDLRTDGHTDVLSNF